MKLQVKIFIVFILLLTAALLIIIDKFQYKVNTEKINSFTTIQKFTVKANEPVKEQVEKIIQKIDNQETKKESKPENNSYIPTEKEEADTEEYSKSKSENIYTVQSGDTLYSISKKFYHTSKYANKLFEYNKNAISKPEKLRVGVQLKIPPAEAFEKKSDIVRK